MWVDGGMFQAQNPGVAIRKKKLSQAATLELIHSLRGSLKRKPGSKPFAEEWADYKYEEKELEERRFWRLMTSNKTRS